MIATTDPLAPPQQGTTAAAEAAIPTPVSRSTPETQAATGKASTTGGRSGIAMGGKPFHVPDADPLPVFPEPTGDEVYVPADDGVDAWDLSRANQELNRIRARLYRLSQALREAQQRYAAAKLRYERALRRALVQVSGGTAETRKAAAELACEPFENDVVVAQQEVEALKQLAMTARADLEAVLNIAHNLRAQMDLR